MKKGIKNISLQENKAILTCFFNFIFKHQSISFNE